MVSGFLGTLISLERAVALKARWPYAAPLLSGLGDAALIVGGPGPPALRGQDPGPRVCLEDKFTARLSGAAAGGEPSTSASARSPYGSPDDPSDRS